MHDKGSLGHTLQIDLPRDWANLALDWDVRSIRFKFSLLVGDMPLGKIFGVTVT